MAITKMWLYIGFQTWKDHRMFLLFMSQIGSCNWALIKELLLENQLKKIIKEIRFDLPLISIESTSITFCIPTFQASCFVWDHVCQFLFHLTWFREEWDSVSQLFCQSFLSSMEQGNNCGKTFKHLLVNGSNLQGRLAKNEHYESHRLLDCGMLCYCLLCSCRGLCYTVGDFT